MTAKRTPISLDHNGLPTFRLERMAAIPQYTTKTSQSTSMSQM